MASLVGVVPACRENILPDNSRKSQTTNFLSGGVLRFEACADVFH